MADWEKIVIAHGAMDCEQLLFRRVEDLVFGARRDPRLLAEPVRIVVPSRSLKEHVAAALVRHFDRCVLGVRVQTLYGLALEISQAGSTGTYSDALFPILVRQLAVHEGELREALEGLSDGFAAVLPAVADLLDAGLDVSHVESLEELLMQQSANPRALAIVRLAAQVETARMDLAIERDSDVLRRARDTLEARQAIATRALLIHGFADATGLATDFIETLVRRQDATIFIDVPPDPAGNSYESDFPRRLLERFSAIVPQVVSVPGATCIPKFLVTNGAEAEVRAVATRVADLLQQGVIPEKIAIVARDLADYAVPLRVHLHKLGVPFSGIGVEGPATAPRRRLQALMTLIEKGVDAPTELWLDLLASDCLATTSDLRVALGVQGAATIADVARIDVADLCKGQNAVALPVRRGLGVAEQKGDGAVSLAMRRTISASRLEETVRTARLTCSRFEDWPQHAALVVHRAHLQALFELLDEPELIVEIGNNPLQSDGASISAIRSPACMRELVDRLAEHPADFVLSQPELVLLLRTLIAEIAPNPIGGQGGGIHILTVMEARARTFSHLFVLGLNRDVFPRSVHDDPLLPDRLRATIGTLLPDIPIKRRGLEEERYLFVQLLTASPDVTISWQTVGDDGKLKVVSPFVERLQIAFPESKIDRVPSLYSAAGGQPTATVVRTAHELATLTALCGSREELAAVLSIAIAQPSETNRQEESAADQLARTKMRILSEIDPDRHTGGGSAHVEPLGPYHGFIGTISDLADPRRSPLFITTIEKLATCPWQTFVQRLLRIDPLPDPLESLPSIDPLILGRTVHSALEKIVGGLRAQGFRGQTQSREVPEEVRWPDGERVWNIVLDAATAALRDSGMPLAGLSQALARRALTYVEVAGKIDWPDPTTAIAVRAVESTGRVTVVDDNDRLRAIHFRADRVDLCNGSLRLTDYKTSKAGAAVGSRQKLLGEVRSGAMLQAVAYALTEADAVGRYLFLAPDASGELPISLGGPEDDELALVFRSVVKTALGAWDRGALFPRLEQGDNYKEPPRCRTCTVAEACLRRDSGSRARLHDWVTHFRRAESAESLDPTQRAWLRLWRLS